MKGASSCAWLFAVLRQREASRRKRKREMRRRPPAASTVAGPNEMANDEVFVSQVRVQHDK